MSVGVVLRQMLKERRRGVLWWSVALVALAVITAGAYPAVRDMGDNLDRLLESMPEGMLELFGAETGIASPEGYLNSQMYSNILPILLLVYGIGMAAWTVAGAERDGTLEPLLANPVSRTTVAVERFCGVAILLAIPTAVVTILLIALRGPFEFGELGAARLVGAGVGTYLLVLVFVALTFAVGAATGSRGAAIAVGAGAAAATYVVFGLASFIDILDTLRVASPWHWFLNHSPMVEGWTWEPIVPPLAVAIPAIVAGTVLFVHRDLH